MASELSHLAEEVVGLVGGTRAPWFPTLRQALDGIDYLELAHFKPMPLPWLSQRGARGYR